MWKVWHFFLESLLQKLKAYMQQNVAALFEALSQWFVNTLTQEPKEKFDVSPGTSKNYFHFFLKAALDFFNGIFLTIIIIVIIIFLIILPREKPSFISVS